MTLALLDAHQFACALFLVIISINQSPHLRAEFNGCDMICPIYLHDQDGDKLDSVFYLCLPLHLICMLPDEPNLPR